jgi:hypothetical protein
LNGTVQEVRAHLLELNPNYDTEFAAAANKSEVPAVVPRGSDNPPNVVICNVFDKPEGRAFVEYLMEGLRYLRSISGQPTLGPGPGTCSRVSCSYDSAIYWCNDVIIFFNVELERVRRLIAKQNLFTKVLPGFYNIADGAEQIIDQCQFWNPIDYKWRVSGQVFIDGPRDWNVFIQWDLC